MSLLDRLLDASVVASFDRSGYTRHARRWSDGVEPPLHGRSVVVTGANSGIGFATAEGLARRGATVHMLCRSPDRGAAAKQTLIERTGGDLRLHIVDLSVAESVRRWTDSPGLGRVDALIHNAGALLDERRFAPDGLEVTFATHVVGPFRLTAGLLPRLADDARIVWVSSGGMYARRLRTDRLTARDGPFDGVATYADCKRAQVVLSEQLAERLAGLATSNAMHPGWAATPGVSRALPRFDRLLRGRLRSPAQGADTVEFLAASPTVAGRTGGFWFDRRPASTHLLPWTRESAAERRKLYTTIASASGLSRLDPKLA